MLPVSHVNVSFILKIMELPTKIGFIVSRPQITNFGHEYSSSQEGEREKNRARRTNLPYKFTKEGMRTDTSKAF
jgi:hypothetical protein